MMGIAMVVFVCLFSLAVVGAVVFFLAKGISRILDMAAYRLLQRRTPTVARRVVATAGALALVIWLPIKGCNHMQVEMYRKAIPPQFELLEVMYHDERSGLRKGCGVAVFRLSDESLARIRSEGLVYLESARLGRDGDPYHQYLPWRSTPTAVEDNNSLFRGAHCVDDPHPFLEKAQRSMRLDGAFFTTGPEQDLVIVPSLGVIIFSHNG